MNTIDTLSNPLLRGIADTQQQREDEARAANDELGQDAFLRLMIAQLNNQDPLNPQENGEFISQLAQFSSVEGITNVNTSINTLVDEVRSSRTLEASSLVGRTVEIDGNTGRLVPGEGLTGSFALSTSSPSVTMRVSDAFGSVVYAEDLGTLPVGEHRFNWDGLGFNGQPAAPGDYRVSITALEDGEAVEMPLRTADVVESVYLGDNNAVVLNLASGRSVPVEEVRRLSQSGSVNSTNTLNQSLDSLVSQFQSSRALEASALVGRSVEYQAESIQHSSQSGGVNANVVLPAGVGDAVLRVSDSRGFEVFSQVLPANAGQQTVSWNGLNNNGAAVADGEYRLAVDAQIGNQYVNLPLNYQGHVNSVSLDNGSGMLLNIDGAGTVPLGQVTRVL